MEEKFESLITALKLLGNKVELFGYRCYRVETQRGVHWISIDDQQVYFLVNGSLRGESIEEFEQWVSKQV